MYNSELQKTRHYGIDLIKIISMYMVIGGHIYMQGGVLAAEEYGSAGYYCSSYIYTLFLCAVDCFVIVNGYVSSTSKFKLSRIIELWAIVVFWSVVVSCFVMAVHPEYRSLEEGISMFLPILRGRYWFFNAYFVLFMFQPILNHVIRSLSKEKYKAMLFAIVCIFGFIPIASLGNDVLRFSGGAEFCWFVMLYLIGGYFRRYGAEFKYKNKWNIVIFFALGSFNILYKFLAEHITMIIFGKPMFGELLLLNSSPIILGEAIALFLFFSRININRNTFGGKCIHYISPLVFAVYIIHVHPLVFWNTQVVDRFAFLAEFNPLLTTGAVLAIGLIIYIICIALDMIRMKLFSLLRVKQICNKLGEKIYVGILKILKIQ